MMRWIVIVLVGCGSVPAVPALPDAPPADAPLPDAPLPDAPLPDAPLPDAPVRWHLVQANGAEGSSLTIDPVGSQNLIIVAVQLDGIGGVTAVSDGSDCNSYVPVPAARATCNGVGSTLEIFYAKNSCPGASRITATGTSEAVAVWEVSGVRTDEPLDTATVVHDPPASITPRGPSITTSTDGEFVVAIAIVDNQVTGTRPGNEFTSDHTTFGNGWAHLTDPMAKAGTYQAQWDQPTSGAYCASAAAFKVAP